MEVADFKRSVNFVSRAIKRIDSFVPCHFCGRRVRRYPAQIAQARNIFCSVLHKNLYYQGLSKGVNQKAFGVSKLVAEALVSGVDPWTLRQWVSKKGEAVPA